jgi:hypothetical protein
VSVYIVGREHIDVLVTGLLGVEAPQALGNRVGRLLWGECVRSVAFHYPEQADGERPGPVGLREATVRRYRWTRRPTPPVWVYSAARSYSSQSDEHPGWEESVARRLVTAVITELEPTVGEWSRDYSRPVAADNPPWDIDRTDLDILTASGWTPGKQGRIWKGAVELLLNDRVRGM